MLSIPTGTCKSILIRKPYIQLALKKAVKMQWIIIKMAIVYNRVRSSSSPKILLCDTNNFSSAATMYMIGNSISTNASLLNEHITTISVINAGIPMIKPIYSST